MKTSADNLEDENCYVENIETTPNPQDFYNTFVHQRQPVILKQQCATILDIPDIRELGDLAKLQQLVLPSLDSQTTKQSTMVEVNVLSQRTKQNNKDDDSDNDDKSTMTPSFSPKQGSRVVEMPFEELCSELLSGSTDYYMTTQTLPLDEEGRPAVCNWLTNELIRQRKLPLRPRLLGRLIPMNAANLWMGRTATAERSNGTSRNLSSSSGLHHDFHDNLYCLLKGRKTVRVAPPETAHKCRMVGRLHTLHDNGRIVYHEQIIEGGPPLNIIQKNGPNDNCPIRPDGALVSVERIVQLEMRKEDIEQQLADDRIDDETQRQQLEDELNEIEEELLDIEMAENNDDEDVVGADDEEEEDDDTRCSLFGGRRESESEKQCACLEQRSAKRARLSSKMHSLSDSGDPMSNADSGTTQNNNLVQQSKSLAIPPNFVLEESDEVVFQTVQLIAGDALYLPAGWFHEVFSHGDGESTDGIHVAVNWWFHPPDATSKTLFERPYESAFWQRDWDGRQNNHRMMKGVDI